MENWDTNTDYTATKKRPLGVILICAILVLSFCINIYQIFQALDTNYVGYVPAWAWFIWIGSLAIGVAVIGGLWLMKKWAVTTYAVLFVINQFLAIFTQFNLLSLIFSFLLLIAMLNYYDKLD